jgi:signal transduction histidine kinase
VILPTNGEIRSRRMGRPKVSSVASAGSRKVGILFWQFTDMRTSKPQPGLSEKAPRPGLSEHGLRTVLLLAFGGLLTLMLGAGVSALFSLRQLHGVEQQVASRFLTRTQALSEVVISVHIYDDELAKFLLDDQAVELREAGTEMAERAAKVHSALQRYPSDGGPRERQLLHEIQDSLFQQESISSAMLSLTPGDRKTRSPRFIQQQLLPRSLSILQVSQEIASLNGEELAKGNQDLLARFASLQSRLKSMLLAALTAGLLLSLLGSLYVLHLERQGRERYLALSDSRLELEKLSARLLDIQEQERRSIARELHDEVGQVLEALLVDLGRLSKLAPANEQAMRDRIAGLKSLAENSVKTVRDIALLLRPSMLDDLGLIPALEWQAREVSRRGEMEVEVHSEMVSELLPDEIKICVYRLVQEALNNAAAHASAKHARVSVSEVQEKLEVEITDDGQGFDPQRVRGMGLLGMEERVKRLGGKLKIASRAGQGTQIAAELPLEPAKSA